MTIKEVEIQLALGTLSTDMKYKLASNKRTSKKVLTILSKNSNSYVRSCVAYNPSTPVEILTILSKDKNSYVRHWVARNHNTPAEVAKNNDYQE